MPPVCHFSPESSTFGNNVGLWKSYLMVTVITFPLTFPSWPTVMSSSVAKFLATMQSWFLLLLLLLRSLTTPHPASLPSTPTLNFQNCYHLHVSFLILVTHNKSNTSSELFPGVANFNSDPLHPRPEEKINNAAEMMTNDSPPKQELNDNTGGVGCAKQYDPVCSARLSGENKPGREAAPLLLQLSTTARSSVT